MLPDGREVEFAYDSASNAWQPFGYAGGLTDAQTGLVRFGARDYDPASGRCTAKDPIGFAGGATSLYAYAANDPANSKDPSGLINWGSIRRGGVSIVAGVTFVSTGVAIVAAAPVVATLAIMAGTLTVPLGIMAVLDGIADRSTTIPQGPFELFGAILDDRLDRCPEHLHDVGGAQARGRIADVFPRLANTAFRQVPKIARVFDLARWSDWAPSLVGVR